MENIINLEERKDKKINLGEVYTVKEVAEYLKVEARTVYSECKEGRLKSFKIRGAIRISEDALKEYMYC